MEAEQTPMSRRKKTGLEIHDHNNDNHYKKNILALISNIVPRCKQACPNKSVSVFLSLTL